MFKIELSDEIKIAHKRYFEKKIILELQNRKVEFADEDVQKFNEENDVKFFKYNIQRDHNDFIKYCIYNKDRISIGDFQELRNINNEIKTNFPIVIKLIKSKFKFSNTNLDTKFRGKKYWEVLFELFGYDKFGDCSLYEVIIKSAKNYTSINIANTDYKKEVVQGVMIYILKKLFPENEIEIDNNLLENRVIDMNKFKGKLNKLEKRLSLALTLDNYKNVEFYDVWNAYLFVFASGIRTCPYCNRQYITPILTSNGKMRGTLDHFVAKSKYPYFSMSLYNLVPTCYNCNSSFKGDTKFGFNDINPYDESMDDYIRFFANIIMNKPMSIDIKRKTSNKRIRIAKYLDTFKLKSQYNYHTNQVGELILKKLIYPKEYIKDIKNKNLKNFRITETKIREQLIGYTENQLKINDEPLSKYRRDIVEQLDFFDNSDLYLINKLEEILEDDIYSL